MQHFRIEWLYRLELIILDFTLLFYVDYISIALKACTTIQPN